MDNRPFSLLTDELPRSIFIQDGTIEIYIKTDTLTALQCLSMLDNDDIPDAVRISCVIETILAEGEEILPDMYLDAFSAILDYLKGFPVEGGTKSREPVFSYSQDHAYVVAGFRQAYGMSLEDIHRTHWWEFQALLSGLPEGTRLSQIMRIRSMDIDPKASPAEKLRIQKAKSLVRIRKRKRKGESGFDIISRGLIEGDRL